MQIGEIHHRLIKPPGHEEDQNDFYLFSSNVEWCYLASLSDN